MYVRIVKVPSSSGATNEYVRIVEAYRDHGKVKQRTIANLGRKDVLVTVLPQLERLLKGQPRVAGEPAPVDILDASTWGPVLLVRQLFDELGLWSILDDLLGVSRSAVSYADRAFVLLANRLIRPKSEHGLARWLETDFVCDRHGRRFVPQWQRRGRVQVDHRQLAAWYSTLDRLHQAKKQIEVRLYHRLRDLFSLQPELVLYDMTSTYFEGAGPSDLARHGYSRDGKPQNVQVVVGLVLVNGWPIAHHVWRGNRIDVSTVSEVVRDLMERFDFRRLVFVGDRGMVSDTNLEELRQQGHGYLLALKRRRNAEVDGWLQQIDEAKWQDCPMGINARERTVPLPTRVQEVDSGDPERRVFVIDSEERRRYEQQKREQAMARTRERLLRLQQRVAAGKLRNRAAIGAAAERALQAHHGYRYYTWSLTNDGVFEFGEHPRHLEREKRLEGRYVIATSEQGVDAQQAVAMYKELTDVERGFRQLKDVLALRPIYHQTADRTEAHIFVAALALLLQRLLERRLQEAGVPLSAAQALEAVTTVRHVTFRVGNEQRSGVSLASPQAAAVLKGLGITNTRPPTPPPGEPTVM